MNLTARGMVAAEVSLPEVKKVDVTSWKCHRLPWNCGEKVPPEQLVIACTQIHEVWNFQKSSDEDDELLAKAMDAFERTQQVGGAAATFKGHEVTRKSHTRRNWYGRCKEHWTKGAAGTGSVDQQAVERHW